MVQVHKRAPFNVPFVEVNSETIVQQATSLYGVIALRMESETKIGRWAGGIRPLLLLICCGKAQPMGLQPKQVLRSGPSGED